jgi:predicted nucleic acid-binding protein
MTSLDTNVLAALWDADDVFNTHAKGLLILAREAGELVVSAPVFAELLADPGREELFLDTFFREADIAVEWQFSEAIIRTAGRAFQSYVQRRRASGAGHPRRILADFLIGAHALVNGYTLLTLDQRHYRKAFPKLKLQKI